MRLAMRAALVAGMSIGVASTHAVEHIDVELVIENDKLVTGAVDRGDPAFPVVPGVRVFTAEFGAGVDIPTFPTNATNLPGFSAQSALAPGSTIGFTVTGPVRRWDAASGDFSEVVPSALNVSLFTTNIVTPDAPGETVPGFNITNVDGTGSVHRHINFVLLDSTPGVYLYEFTISTTQAGVEDSDEVFVVFNMQSDQADADAAAAYVEGLLADDRCPGDVTGDGFANTADLLALLASFGSSGMLPNTGGDLDGSRSVDTGDLLELLSVFNSTCP